MIDQSTCLVGLAIICIVIFVVYLDRQIQYTNQGKAIFTGHVPEARAKFLLDIFSLPVDELKQLHFDGFYFYLKEKQSYKNFSKVLCVNVADITVINPSLPHSTSWRYTRVVGGPDLRYKNNPMTMTSRRFLLRFDGAKSYILFVYSKPYFGDLNPVLEKFNNLFSISKVIDLESRFNQYEAVFTKAQQSQILLDTTMLKKTELESVLAASKRLATQSFPLDNLSSKQNDVAAELDSLNSEILQLKKIVTSAKNQMASIIQDVHREINQFKDLQVVKSYQKK